MNKKEIKKHFTLLTKKFIGLDKYCKIKFDFRENFSEIDFGEKEKFDDRIINAATHCVLRRYKRSFLSFWWWSYPHALYTVFFLNHYPSVDDWRKVAVHEFTHVYIYQKKFPKNRNKNIKISDIFHEHDDNFYSKMDYFEDWLDKELNLSARQNKGYDWIQHINPLRAKERWLKYNGRSELEAKEEVKKYKTDDFPVFGESVVHISSNVGEISMTGKSDMENKETLKKE
ncbi:MAG: hypothetical protein I3274_04155 [Candidatus Moeniiplasma glomeromycotorum]|nr:hypothetical protein [Candidatus Moeniiplasma glomeromycotorum]MCE8167872.1 hypothetical protein [Candidatus Moeniiplasma glomeromycotorum]